MTVTNSWLDRLTSWAEETISRRAIAHGWHVLRVSEIGSGAAMIQGRGGKIIMPDLQLLDIAGNRHSRFVEVKAKTTGAYRYQKQGVWCTGTDRHKWQAYQKIDAAGIPVDVAFIHLKHRKTDAEFNPYLLWSPIANLPQPMEFDDPHFPSGAVVWDVTDGVGPFQHLGFLDVPPGILAGAAAAKCKMHPWDYPPRLRLPKARPML